jgi:hypothetical protein
MAFRIPARFHFRAGSSGRRGQPWIQPGQGLILTTMRSGSVQIYGLTLSLTPKLEGALSKVCSRQSGKEVTDSSGKSGALSISGGKVLAFEPFFGNDYKGGYSSILADKGDPSYLLKDLAHEHYTISLPTKGGREQKKWSYRFYAVDRRVVDDMPQSEMTKRYNGSYGGNKEVKSMQRLVRVRVFAVLADGDGKPLLRECVGQFSFGRIAGCDISLLPLLAPFGAWGRPCVPVYEWKNRVSVPTKMLAGIASIRLITEDEAGGKPGGGAVDAR